MTYVPLKIVEGNYCIRSLSTEADLLKAYRLRYEVFCKTLKWIPESPEQLDMDKYDQGAHLLGVFTEEGELYAVARIITPDHPYMLETAFAALVDAEHVIRKNFDTAEVTRLTVSPSLKKQWRISPGQISKLLYKGIYQWSVLNYVRYLYLVVEKKFWKALLFTGFPCVPVGLMTRLPPAQVESVAAILDWNRFRHEGTLKHTQFLDWISTNQLAPTQWQAQWRDHGLTNAALPKHFAHETLPYAL